MMTNEQFTQFIINLKLLNAKERDHLMRYAYLGKTDNYNDADCYLSPKFTEDLKPHLANLWFSKELEKLNEPENYKELDYLKNSKCVFAGMDYHLDWLYVALKFAIDNPTFDITDEPNLKIKFPMEAVQESDIFREISGSQEDIDLIAVFKSEVDSKPNKYAIFFIEAKGCADFDGVQLARKLIRLDNILKISDALSLIMYRLILAAPNLEIQFDNCRDFALSMLENKQDKSVNIDMKEALSSENHLSRIGDGLHYMHIPFPKTFGIKRIKDPKSGFFTKWKFFDRNNGAKKNDA